MEQKSIGRLIYKIPSQMLKKAKWNLKLTLKEALSNNLVSDGNELVVTLSSSQCLRFIDEINGVGDITEQFKELQRKIRAVRKLEKNQKNRSEIRRLYDSLYALQFQKDYVCVIMANNADYDRANKGFSIDFGDSVVRYRRLLGTNGGIKNSVIVYVNEKIYDELKRRLDNGRDKSVPMVPAKLEAYQALICSGSTPLPQPKGFIVVNDCITRFKEDVIMIEDGIDEPRLYHKAGHEIEHNNSDGYGFMLPSYSRKVNEYLTGDGEHEISGMNTRYAWTKGMIYTFDFIEFAEKVAGTYEITDAWGTKRDIRDAEVILTVSMLKLWKSYSSWEDYFENCERNHYQFSATKTTPQELENVRDTNYQFLQSYNFTDEEIIELCNPTIQEIKDVIGIDYRKSLAFLAGFGLNDKNVWDDTREYYVKALMAEPRLINDPFIRSKIHGLIKTRIEMGQRGAVRINANYAMISGDLYALAQSMFGLPVTGLLKAGEIYHRYWIDKGADEVSCFRAPMTCHNNIRRMKLSKSEDAAYWFRYVRTACILNAWDTTCEAMNGADFDGDTTMCTDNPIIVRNTLNLPTIVCAQKSASKVIPQEADIIAANKLAFNDEIGAVTNRVTSMIERQAGFAPDSDEYKVLAYRIMCGQKFQQDTIDRCKGIIAKKMPTSWYLERDSWIRDDDDEETIEWKTFNRRIVASKKPYFMTYVYPSLKSENSKYMKTCDSKARVLYCDIGVGCAEDIRRIEPKTQEMTNFLYYYDRDKVVGENACVVNRICWLFEREFHGYLSKYRREVRLANISEFDRSILKSGVKYSKYNYNKVSELYDCYKIKVAAYMKESMKLKASKEDLYSNDKVITYFFQSQCYSICQNEDELCDILIDLCYSTENSKRFTWILCSDVILSNLLTKNSGIIRYPVLVEDGEDFVYSGHKFAMRKKELEANGS